MYDGIRCHDIERRSLSFHPIHLDAQSMETVAVHLIAYILLKCSLDFAFAVLCSLSIPFIRPFIIRQSASLSSHLISFHLISSHALCVDNCHLPTIATTTAASTAVSFRRRSSTLTLLWLQHCLIECSPTSCLALASY